MHRNINILLRTEDETLRRALEILSAEQGGRLLSTADLATGKAVSVDCILTDLDHPSSDEPFTNFPSAPEYTVSFHESKHPTLLRPFGEELFRAVLCAAAGEKETDGGNAAESAESAEPAETPRQEMGGRQAYFAHPSSAALFFDGSAVYTDTAGKKITLSEKERQVFKILYDACEKPVRVSTLAKAVWNSENAENNVRVYIRYLRKKLESITDRKYLQTVRGGAFLLRRSSDG